VKAPAVEAIDDKRLARGLYDRVRLRLGGDRAAFFELESCAPGGWGGRVVVQLRTNAPSPVLAAADEHARAEGLLVGVWASDVDPIERAVRRLLADVDALERARR